MNRKYRVKKALLQAVNKEACTHPIFGQMEAHAAQLANNPDAQRIRQEAHQETLRELRPGFAIAAVVVIALWWALARYLPGLFSDSDAVVGAGVCLAFLAFVRASI